MSTKPRVISFHYTLTDFQGTTLDSSAGREPLLYMEGSGQIIPGLERELASLKKGDKKTVKVPHKEAYGVRNEQLVIKTPKAQFPIKDVQVGQQFQLDGDPEGRPFTVMLANDQEVILDGNHPLASVDLVFDVEIAEIREATDEEMSHGHAHGGDGHHH